MLRRSSLSAATILRQQTQRVHRATTTTAIHLYTTPKTHLHVSSLCFGSARHDAKINRYSTTVSSTENQSTPPITPTATVFTDATDDNEITIEDFAKINLVVGTILTVEQVPKSKKLLKLTVDLGGRRTSSTPAQEEQEQEQTMEDDREIRTILSGVRPYYATEEAIQRYLVNKQCVVVENLKPRSMMGHLSHGMILFATGVDSEGKPSITLVGPNDRLDLGGAVEMSVTNGTRVL